MPFPAEAGRPNPPVLWTRGDGCGDLADLLGGGSSVRVEKDLEATAVAHRSRLLVSRRLPGSVLLSVAVPVDVEFENVTSVVAAVAGGPHSELAARVARRIGSEVGIPASMVCAYRSDGEKSAALRVVEEIYPQVSDLEYRIVEATGPAELIGRLPEKTLLVFGAPGGNWFQRVLFSRGAKLRQQAPSGAVVVRRAPDRAFQFLEEAVFVAPLRTVDDISRVHDESALAVVDGGRVLGVVRPSSLETAPPGTTAGDIMEEPVAVGFDTPLTELSEALEVYGPDPIPVVDGSGRLLGSLRPAP